MKKAANLLALFLVVSAAIGISYRVVEARLTGTNPTGTSADAWCTGRKSNEACVDSSGNVLPTTNNTQTLGTSALQWSNIYATAVTNTGNEAVTGNLTVNGNTTLGDNVGNDILTLNAGSVTIRAIVPSVFIATATTANAPLMQLDGSNLRVGINTATPATLLDVNGAATIRGQMTVTGSSITINTLTGNPTLKLTANDGSDGAVSTPNNSMDISAVQQVIVGTGGGASNTVAVGNAPALTLVVGDLSGGVSVAQVSVNGTETVTSSATFRGAIDLFNRTLAQLQAITPGLTGETYYCSNCSPAKIVVATGTSAGNFADAVGAVFK